MDAEIIARRLMSRIAELQQKPYDRAFIRQTEDMLRTPDFAAPTGWVIYLDENIKAVWYHLNDMSKLLVYLTALRKSSESE